MRFGIGSLRDNQRTRLCLIWINCVWKKSVDNEALVMRPSRDFRRDMTCRDVTWRDMMWHDMARRDITWHYVTLRDMTWHEVHDVACRGMTWQREITWHGVTWRDMAWCIVAWRDMTWHNVAWHDITWHDNKVDNKALVVWPSGDIRATAYEFRAFFCQGTNVWVTSKTPWIKRWPKFLRSPKHGSQ